MNMNNTNFPQFVLMLVFSLTGLTLSAQEIKEAVILYNTQPVKAEITADGTVNRIISEAPDHLKGFKLKEQDYGQFIENQKKSVVPVAKSQPYAIVSNEQSVVKFEIGYATLSDDAIDILDKVVMHLRTNPNEKAVLVSLSKLNNSPITKNRLNSIRSYLKIRGIDTERVLIESLLGDLDIDEIKINYLK